MKHLIDFREEIHKCSKCGLCQAECPIYQATGNDCAVSRGQFVMLKGVIKGELKLSKTINRYLDLCLKCGACSKFCPSGIDVVDVIISAKSEYFKTHRLESFISFIQKHFVFGLLLQFVGLFHKTYKSKTFSEKVIYFGGCGSKLKGDLAVIKLLNNIGVEVINPNFHCCGIPFLVRGDLKEFGNSIKNYIKFLRKYDIKEIVTTCASCEKSLKDYIKWADVEDAEFLKDVKVKNIYKYLYEKKVKLTLKSNQKVTYHKPCNIDNYEDISWILNNTENLEYVEMKEFDKCCGLNGILKLKEWKIVSKIFNKKQRNIETANTKIVLTSCLGCETALKLYSIGKYSVYDLIHFLASYL